MNHSPAARFFLINPSLALVLVMLISLGGLLAFKSLIRENNPDLGIPQATISTEWPGASPEQVEKEVTKPLEDAIRALPGLRDHASSSRNSLSLIVVRFEAGESIPEAMAGLRAKVDEARTDFPRAAKLPKVEQVAVSDLPILTLSVSGDVPEIILSERAQELERQLEQLPGIRRVDLQGLRERSLHVRANPTALRDTGIPITRIRDRILEANQDLTLGNMERTGSTVPAYVEGRFLEPSALEQLTLARLGEDRVVRLGEVARAFIGLNEQDTETRVSIGGGEFSSGVTVSLLKRSGFDTMEAIAGVRAFLQQFEPSDRWHPGLQIIEISGEDEIIEASLNEVFSNLFQGSIPLFLILLLAMTWREATVVVLALPVLFLGTLFVCQAIGYTLNVIVVLGMVIALGIMVDVFILVMEGLHEGMYVQRLDFPDAAVRAAKTYFLPALSGQATNILALVPLLAIGGIDGKFIRLIPIVAIICLVLSVIMAFLVCIPASGLILPRRIPATAKLGISDRLTERLVRLLEGFLRAGPLLNRPRAFATVLVAFLLLVLSLIMIGRQPEILYPRDDRRSLGITLVLRPDATFGDAQRVARKAGEYIRQQPMLASVATHAGEVSPFSLLVMDEFLQETRSPALVGISATFVPKDQRDRLSFEYVEELREGLRLALTDEPGVVVRMFPDPGNDTNGDPIRIEVQGDDFADLAKHAGEVEAMLAGVAGLTDVRTSLGQFRSETRLVANSEALTFHGLSEPELMEQARFALSADEIGKFRMPGGENDLDLRLGMDWPSRNGAVGGPSAPWEFGSLSFTTPSGAQVPAAALLSYRVESIPSAIQHSRGARAVTVYAKLSGTTTAGEVVEAISPRLEEISADWPSNVTWRIRGEAETAAETYGSLGIATVAALVLVFAVLVLQFQSVTQPFIIMLTVPLGITGVGIGYYLLDIPVSFPGLIGIIALIGIVVNNSILMVEVMNTRLAEGLHPLEAAARGAASRLRPILTTSLTTVAGLLPLAFSSPTWYPLCMAVVLGLSVSTLLGFLVIPSLYVLLTRGAERPA